MKSVTKGFLDTREARQPPPGPQVDWPGRAATIEQRRNFRAALSTLVNEQGLTVSEFAHKIGGTYHGPKGEYNQPRIGTPVRNWLSGEMFPTAETANGLARYFGKSLQFFLEFDGRVQPVAPGRTGVKKKSNGNGAGNGHDGPPMLAAPSKPKPEPAPPRPLPEGAAPLALEFKTHPTDPDFATISITGTASLDVCLGLIAFIERHRSPRE